MWHATCFAGSNSNPDFGSFPDNWLNKTVESPTSLSPPPNDEKDHSPNQANVYHYGLGSRNGREDGNYHNG